jgi:hypothetical protein
MSKASRRASRHQRGPTRGQQRRDLIDQLTDPAVINYAGLLFNSGMEPRECYRAALYAEANGMGSLSPDDDACVHFDEPTCANWDCLSPDHQVVVFSHHNH